MRIDLDEKIVITEEDTEKALFNTGGVLRAQSEMLDCIESRELINCSECHLAGITQPCDVGRRVTFVIAAEYQRLATEIRRICAKDYATDAERDNGRRIIAQICYANYAQACDGDGGTLATIGELLEWLEKSVTAAKAMSMASSGSN